MVERLGMFWVDKIGGRYISVGNETHLEREGMVVYHTRRYKTANIEDLEVF